MTTESSPIGIVTLHLHDGILEAMTPDRLTAVIRQALADAEVSARRHTADATNLADYVRCFIGGMEFHVYGAMAYWECPECGEDMDDDYELCEECEV